MENFKDPVGAPMGQVFFSGGGFDKDYGHIGAVETFDKASGNFTTVEFNHNGDGKMTRQSYNVNDLKAKGVHVGFYNNTTVAQKLASGSTTGVAGTEEATAKMRNLLRDTDYNSSDKEAILKLVKQGKDINTISSMYPGVGETQALTQIESTQFSPDDFSEAQKGSGYQNIKNAITDYKKAYGEYIGDGDIVDSMLFAAETQGYRKDMTKALVANGIYPFDNNDGDTKILGQLTNNDQLQPIVEAMYDDGLSKDEIYEVMEANANTQQSFWWDSETADKLEDIIDKLK